MSIVPALTLKSQDEIVARLREVRSRDFLGFATEVLVVALDYEHAQPFLKEGVTEEEWLDGGDISLEGQRDAALAYLDFAWGKAEDHRGISAGRSVTKLSQWAWLLGLDDVAYRMKHGPYAQYGAPALKVFATAMGVPLPESPELRNMMDGLPCRPGCMEGCGR